MGLRFPSPLSMPCVVPFPDQALHPVGMGDSGLVLAEHLQFYLLMQECPAQLGGRSVVIHSSAVKLKFSVRDQFSQCSYQSEQNESSSSESPRHYCVFR